jgi:enoyl-CoA hydratase/carnithine racemase
VNYSCDAVRFGAPPAPDRLGSTLGGTGIAISRRAEVGPALVDHLRWLLAPETQAGFIPRNAGQPGLRSAWRDATVDDAAHGFYSATLDTIEAAWIRPRFAGYIPFQQAASRIVRETLAGSRTHAAALDEIDARYRIEQEEHVVTVRLNRPEKLNAVTQEMSDELERIAHELNADESVRAIVYTGTGRAFSAGSDIRTLDRYATPWQFRNRRDYCDALRELRKPVVAAIGGYAFGGGLESALTCDIRIAADTAMFAAPEIKLGWIGGGGMSALLADSIGASNAALMLMTGDPIDAGRALAWGLVSEVVPADDVIARAQQIARTIAQRPPIAAETAKATLRAAANLPQDQAIAYEREMQGIAFATQDAAEGRAAFAEKRDGVFRGR